MADVSQLGDLAVLEPEQVDDGNPCPARMRHQGSTVRVWDLVAGVELASWAGDFNVVACIVLPGQPLKIAVGQDRGRPYLLELRGQHVAT